MPDKYPELIGYQLRWIHWSPEQTAAARLPTVGQVMATMPATSLGEDVARRLMDDGYVVVTGMMTPDGVRDARPFDTERLRPPGSSSRRWQRGQATPN